MTALRRTRCFDWAREKIGCRPSFRSFFRTGLIAEAFCIGPVPEFGLRAHASSDNAGAPDVHECVMKRGARLGGYWPSPRSAPRKGLEARKCAHNQGLAVEIEEHRIVLLA